MHLCVYASSFNVVVGFAYGIGIFTGAWAVGWSAGFLQPEVIEFGRTTAFWHQCSVSFLGQFDRSVEF
jgi:hypothetical protein